MRLAARPLGERVGGLGAADGAESPGGVLADERVAITDNAEPRLNVLEYSRGRHVAGDRLVCKPPLFAPRAGKNSFMGYGRFLVVENNAGHDVFPSTAPRNTEPGGAARVDLGTRADGRRVVRESREISQTTAPKLSLANGLVRMQRTDREVTVRGVAQRDVTANRASWSVSYSESAFSLAEALAATDRDTTLIRAYLAEHGAGR